MAKSGKEKQELRERLQTQAYQAMLKKFPGSETNPSQEAVEFLEGTWCLNYLMELYV